MILEIATLQVKAGQEAAFEAALREASPIIARARGYITHQLQRCIETQGRYVLMVQWQTLEDHTQGFRGSADYQEWRARLHHFYDSALVEHYDTVLNWP
jgi:heme-degrading monooxygenase HmoA